MWLRETLDEHMQRSAGKSLHIESLTNLPPTRSCMYDIHRFLDSEFMVVAGDVKESKIFARQFDKYMHI